MTTETSAMTRPELTITAAAKAAGVDRKTIERRLDKLAELGAYKDDGGVWRIPVEALLHPDMGLRLYAPSPPDAAPTPVPLAPTRAADPAPASVRDEVDQLRAQLNAERARADLAEALLAERDRTVRIAELALRQLPPAPPSAAPEAPRRRGWLWRGTPS